MFFKTKPALPLFQEGAALAECGGEEHVGWGICGVGDTYMRLHTETRQGCDERVAHRILLPLS